MQCTLTYGSWLQQKLHENHCPANLRKKDARNKNLMRSCQEPMTSAKVQPCLLFYLFVCLFVFNTALQKHIYAHWKFLSVMVLFTFSMKCQNNSVHSLIKNTSILQDRKKKLFSYATSCRKVTKN